MKKLLFSLLALSFINTDFSQPAPIWSSDVACGINGYWADAPKIKFDKAGDLIVAGNRITSATKMDMLVMKYSPSGTLIWQSVFNGPANQEDELLNFETDKQNNIYVTGKSRMDSIYAHMDMITLKFNAAGALQWTNTYNGFANHMDEGRALTLDTTGNVYVVGSTNLDSTYFYNYLVLRKINPLGATVWTQRYGAIADSLGYFYRGLDKYCELTNIKIVNNQLRVSGSHFKFSVGNMINYLALALDLNGNVLLAAEPLFDRGAWTAYIDVAGNFFYGGVENFGMTKLNANGTFAWRDTVPSNLPWNSHGDDVYAITGDSLGNVYATGRHYGPNFGSPTTTNFDFLTMKYSPAGTVLWSKRYSHLGTNLPDIAQAICLDKDLNVYAGGISASTTGPYIFDYSVVKYSNGGTEIGTIRYAGNGPGNNSITSVLVDDNLDVYVTGLTAPASAPVNITTQKYGIITGIGEQKLPTGSLAVFPNPFTDRLEILLPNNNSGSLKIYSVTGQLVVEKTYASAARLELQLPGLAPGCYHVILQDKDRMYQAKLVKAD